MSLNRRVFRYILLSLGLLALLPMLKATGATPTRLAAPDLTVSPPIIPSLTLTARDAPLYQAGPLSARDINPRQTWQRPINPDRRGVGGQDPFLNRQAQTPPRTSSFLTPSLNFPGQGYTNVNPPDTVGDVGPNHYIQMVNGGGGALFRIYNKSGALLAGPISLDSLGVGGPCSSGFGDPVVLYDRLADRWLMSEFAGSGNHLCVYISQTSDPLNGAWYRYDFPTPTFPDYPKYAVWSDAYYVSSNENNPAAYALDRAQMLAGQPATSQRFTAPPIAGFGFQAMTPGDLDSADAPPSGAPGYFMRHRDDEVHNPGSNDPIHDFLEIWAFHVDFTTPANSTFTLLQNVPVTEFDSDLCGLVSFSCFPQPGSSVTLDPLREVVMWRLQYRNFGSYETLVGNLVTDVNGADHGGIRWFELRKEAGLFWSLYQEGTLAPDQHHRWMGSIAMDGSGNMALGYSVSSTTVFPSIRYAGRLLTDPLGVLPYTEGVIVAGSAANGSNRWGDYSAMSVDPADDCTFWYTHMYSPASQWATQIAAFRFPECTGSLGPDFALAATPTTQAVCAPNSAEYAISLDFLGGYNAPVNLSAANLPTGATALFEPDTVITPTVSSALTLTTSGVAAGNYLVDVVGFGVPTPTHTTTVGLDVYTGPPSPLTLLTPADGATGVPLRPTLTWAAGAGILAYAVEVAADPAFIHLVYTDSVADPSLTLPEPLVPDSTYYWRVTATNICGVGATSNTFSFTTLFVSPILLVDDDDNAPNTRAYYANILTSLGADYDIWDTADSTTEPTPADLAPYETVIWFTGDDINGAAGPGAASESALAGWLDAGGCLFLSSQDYLHDRGVTAFGTTYLGLDAFANDDGNYNAIVGQGPVFGNLGTFTLQYPFSDRADRLTPGPLAATAFAGSNGRVGAIYHTDDVYQTIFWGLPFEAVSGIASRQVILQTVLDWCAAINGVISGVVTMSMTGTPLAGATVTADNGSQTFTATTGADGSYTLTLPPGIYSMTAELDGYLTQTAPAVSVRPGGASWQDFTLNAIVYAVDLGSDQAASGAPGESVMYELVITNLGNSADTFDLSLTTVWDATISAESILLAPGVSANLTVTVTIPGDAAHNAQDVAAVAATSQGDATATAQVNLTTTAIAPVYAVSLTPDQAASGAPGESVMYELVITNLGNSADTFDLSLTTVWDATISAESIFLAPGFSANLTVTVAIPGDAAHNAQDVAAVTATSQGNAAATSQVNLTTTALRPRFMIYLPVAMREEP